MGKNNIDRTGDEEQRNSRTANMSGKTSANGVTNKTADMSGKTSANGVANKRFHTLTRAIRKLKKPTKKHKFNKGVKMHMSKRIWIEKHHKVHDELIDTATSGVGKNINKHIQLIDGNRKLQAKEPKCIVAARHRQKVVDFENEGIMHLLLRVKERKNRYHGNKNDNWHELIQQKKIYRQKAVKAAVESYKQKIEEENKVILGHLCKIKSSFSAERWKKDYKRHLHMRKVMAQVSRPKNKKKATHKYSFVAGSPASERGIPEYNADMDVCFIFFQIRIVFSYEILYLTIFFLKYFSKIHPSAAKWTKSKACRIAMKKYNKGAISDRRARIAKHSKRTTRIKSLQEMKVSNTNNTSNNNLVLNLPRARNSAGKLTVKNLRNRPQTASRTRKNKDSSRHPTTFNSSIGVTQTRPKTATIIRNGPYARTRKTAIKSPKRSSKNAVKKKR